MANGTIAFDTLSTSGQISGTAKSVDTDYLASGSAKAWLNYKGTSTNAINASLNTTSVTDNGTGDYTQNMTNNLLWNILSCHMVAHPLILVTLSSLVKVCLSE